MQVLFFECAAYTSREEKKRPKEKKGYKGSVCVCARVLMRHTASGINLI